eukprot:NODE_190_length_15503_cov_0.365814.p13 type:complete len:121 gc:universal NODE_190_length_15503_cov_0.365814:7708-7346(-)
MIYSTKFNSRELLRDEYVLERHASCLRLPKGVGSMKNHLDRAIVFDSVSGNSRFSRRSRVLMKSYCKQLKFFKITKYCGWMQTNQNSCFTYLTIVLASAVNDILIISIRVSSYYHCSKGR